MEASGAPDKAKGDPAKRQRIALWEKDKRKALALSAFLSLFFLGLLAGHRTTTALGIGGSGQSGTEKGRHNESKQGFHISNNTGTPRAMCNLIFSRQHPSNGPGCDGPRYFAAPPH